MSSPKPPTKRTIDANDEDCKPPAKRVRQGKKGRDNTLASNSDVTIPLDAMCSVMEFLSPRQLYNLAFTCKTLREFVTTKIVVRSALIHGGFPSRTMEELQNLMSRKAMHVPSPLRLLRLANGKRCEFCKGSKVNHVRPYLGVFACWDCVSNRGLTKPWKTTWSRYRHNSNDYEAIFEHPRVAANRFTGKVYMWAKLQKDFIGEKVGPLVTFNDVDKMAEWMGRGRYRPLQDYFSKCLDAPEDEEYKEFNQAYKEAKQWAKQAQREREEKKRLAKEKTKGNKKAKLEKMVEDLAGMLDEPFREIALEYTEPTYSHDAKLSKLPSIIFNVAFIDKLLREYVMTPSKIRKKILGEVAETINQNLRLVAEKRFLSFDYLSDEKPFEAALKAEFRGRLTGLRDLLDTEHENSECRREAKMVDSKFFSLLKKNQLIVALAHLKDTNLSCLLLPKYYECALFNQYGGAKKLLARTIWFSELSKAEKEFDDKDDDQRFSQAFDASVPCFRDATRGIQGYMDWLNGKTFPCTMACKVAWAIPFLVSGDYEGLDKKMDEKKLIYTRMRSTTL